MLGFLGQRRLERRACYFPFFAGFAAEHGRLVAGCARNVRFAAGDYLFAYGCGAGAYKGIAGLGNVGNYTTQALFPNPGFDTLRDFAYVHESTRRYSLERLEAFREAVLVQYPRAGTWTIAFVTVLGHDFVRAAAHITRKETTRMARGEVPSTASPAKLEPGSYGSEERSAGLMVKTLFELSDRHGFVIASDECYSEIYFRDEAPLGGLEAALKLGRTDFRNLVAFTSLSKRSNVPGLRSGFVAGDAAILKQFLLYRTYHGSAMAEPTQLASITAWDDEQQIGRAHV